MAFVEKTIDEMKAMTRVEKKAYFEAARAAFLLEPEPQLLLACSNVRAIMSGSGFSATPSVNRTFYHGTSLEAACSIQRTGFDVDLSGSNAGTLLGNGPGRLAWGC